MLIQQVPAKTDRGQEPAGPCRGLPLRARPFGSHDTAVVGNIDSRSWALGHRGRALQSAGDRPVREATAPEDGPAIKAGRVAQQRVGPLQERGAEFIEGKALLSHVPPLYFWDRRQSQS